MDKNEKSGLKRLNNVIKNNMISIIAVILLLILCGYFYSYKMVVPKYKSISTIVLTSDNINNKGKVDSVTQSDLTLNKSLIATYRKILKSSKVLNQVIGNLNLEMTEDELYQNIEIEEIKDTQIIQVGVINEKAEEAQKIAEELNNVFIEEVKQIYKVDNISIVDRASLETQPYNVHHMVDIFVFFIIGVVCSTIMIIAIYVLDSTIKIEQDIEEYVRINVIGTIPFHKSKTNAKGELIVQNNGKSVISEAFKTVRTNISFSKVNSDSRTILFTSGNAGEGKSWIASNMAVAYAWSNKNVIIVDADMRKGRQHNIFHVSNENGLSDCLTALKGRDDFETLQTYIKQTNVPKVHIMTIGTMPPNPSELLSSGKMNDFIHMLKCVYDIIIIDGTPCNLVADSIPLSRIVDSTIVVTESRRTKIEDLKNVIKLIKNVGGNIEGVILNKKKVQSKEYGKGYYYGKVEKNVTIDLETQTVAELFHNRKEYVETQKELGEENVYNEKIIELAKTVESLENKLLKIPDMNLENYTKAVEEIRTIYENEIDKNKLAENIKDNIIKNELVKKLEQNHSDTRDMLRKQIENIDYAEQLNELADKISHIENMINNNAKQEQVNELMDGIDDVIDLINTNDKSEQINNIVNKLDNMKELLDESATVDDIDDVIDRLKAMEKISDEDMKNLTSKMDIIDNTIEMKEIAKELKKINERYDKLAESVSKKIFENNQINKTQQTKQKKVTKNNVIELEEAKKKLEQEELVIEYGGEITYEQLLDLAIDIYDIDPQTNTLKRVGGNYAE